MEWTSDYRKAIDGSAILAGLIVVVIDFVQGDILTASIVLAVVVVAGALLVWWTRPGGGGLHVSHAAAQAAAGDGDVMVFVVARRDGNEEVPTVVTGAGDLIDATPEAIKAQLGAES